jgi:hypothetical protein
VSLILRPVEELLPVPVDTSCPVGVRRTAYCVVRHTRCHGNHLSRPVRNNKLQHNCAYSRSLYNTGRNKSSISRFMCTWYFLHSHHFPSVRILVHRSTAVQFIKKHYRLWVSTQHIQQRIVCYS